jgi:glycosyltransferase involved in cell wall biosynthesis
MTSGEIVMDVGASVSRVSGGGHVRAVVSIVLGSYNRKSFLIEAIASIRRNGITVPYEIIVVDGGSTDGALEWLSRQSDIITIIQHNRTSAQGQSVKRRSWGYFMNLGFKTAEGQYIVMMSDDSLLVPGAVMNGLKHCESLSKAGRHIGAVAFYWRNWPEQQEYWVGLTLGRKMFVNHGLYVRSAIEHVGWLDDDRFKFYYADGDVCLKLWQQGYEVVDCQTSFVEHYSHANETIRASNFVGERSDWNAYLTKWEGIFYDSGKPDIGTWLKMSYDDPHRTVRCFPVAQKVVHSFRGYLDLIKRRISFRHRMFPDICESHKQR